MNILVFTTAFYPLIGGLEKHTYYLVKEFLNKGHKVKVIAFQTQPTIEQAIQIKEKAVEVYYNPSFLKVGSLFIWCNVLYMPNVSLKGGWFIPFLLFKRWIISHNDSYLSNRKSTKIRIKLLLVKLATQNISVSRHIAKHINTRSKIIYNCFDNEVFKIYQNEEKRYELVFLGRLVSQKGCELLIKACKNLKYSFRLNIIGDGPERSSLERMVKDFGLQNCIHFLGILTDEPLARTLNRHHIMIIPSIGEEGFGIVALEGMACGCKIIAADAGGLAEAVNGFGKLFKMGDQQELEYLLNMELEELLTPIPKKQHTKLNEYLTGQSKKALADKYLQLF
jgi:glycogen(starch) synthase